MYETVAPESWPCELCGKPSRPRVHAGCQANVDENLAVLPALYRQLEDALYPRRQGPSVGTTVSGTPGRSLPGGDALDLRARGGIEGVVTTWERDAREILGWAPPPFRGNIEQTIEGAVEFLRINLSWFCDEHPAVKELAADVRRLRTECEVIITGERPERRVTVACPCGGTMRVTVSTPGARCPGCHTQYGHDEVLRLPLVERAAA